MRAKNALFLFALPCLLLLGAGCASQEEIKSRDYESLQSGKVTDSDIRQAVNQLKESPDNIYIVGSPLGQYGERAQAAIPVLIGYLGSERSSVRESAAEALGNFGPLASEAVPQLEAQLRANGVDSPPAAEALARIQGAQAIPTLIAYLENDPKRPRAVATTLANFPPSELEPYGIKERRMKAVLGPISMQQSTREPLWLTYQVMFAGQIRVNGRWHEAELDGYTTADHEVIHVITTPSGQKYRLNDDMFARCGRSIRQFVATDLIYGGAYVEHPWEQDDLPDFTEEGVFTIHVEGQLSHPHKPPLPYVSNEITFEQRKGNPTRSEILQMNEDALRREFPLGHYFVHGEVEHTGKFGLTKNLTVTEAVLQAKPSRFTHGHIRLTRDTPKGKSVYEFKLEELMESGEKIYIENGDSLYVRGDVVEGTKVRRRIPD